MSSAALTYESLVADELDVAFIDDADVLQRVRDDGASAFHDLLGGQAF